MRAASPAKCGEVQLDPGEKPLVGRRAPVGLRAGNSGNCSELGGWNRSASGRVAGAPPARRLVHRVAKRRMNGGIAFRVATLRTQNEILVKTDLALEDIDRSVRGASPIPTLLEAESA